MFKMASLFSLLFLCIGLTPIITLAQKPVVISSAEITFSFVSKDVQGSIAEFSANTSLDFDHIERASLEGSVAVSSLKTGNFLRDWSLKGKKYFDADNYPKITFKSTSVSGTGEAFTVKGMLTIKDISKSITIDFKKEGNTLVGTTTLFSSDFNIDIKKERTDNKVIVTLQFTLEASN
ncbi:YceI family protein [Kriegella aquimaris]|uniref:Polyisoprenoid-binding protein YceI n=1 Tax=Kriegella aquimaris TaxID=192904 RepID=A0A1G9IGV4_9FLAO|nr:YceI family protein [Kriegella aquimaris]SDL24154.1 Polyisoprenoid-binding protein YceI [Kriegella aquimaris]